jgi:hypothetical protein
LCRRAISLPVIGGASHVQWLMWGWILALIIPNWQISSKILKLLKMRHENASSASRSNRIPDSGGA